MYKCSECGKEYKTESRLTKHQAKCFVEVQLDESDNEIVAEPTEIVAELNERVQCKIKKLQDLRKSTFDAKTRNDIDLQIKELSK